MTFDELLTQVGQLPNEGVREQKPGLLEFVVNKDQLSAVLSLLVTYFKAPFKPAGSRPSAEATVFSRSYGGIQAHQTMYFQKKSGCAEMVLLWPWSNGEMITIKIIRDRTFHETTFL